MTAKGYFHRVQAETPTRFWVNNPTLEQAKQALAEGAVGCTTNPSYVSKLFSSPEDSRRARPDSSRSRAIPSRRRSRGAS